MIEEDEEQASLYALDLMTEKEKSEFEIRLKTEPKLLNLVEHQKEKTRDLAKAKHQLEQKWEQENSVFFEKARAKKSKFLTLLPWTISLFLAVLIWGLLVDNQQLRKRLLDKVQNESHQTSQP